MGKKAAAIVGGLLVVAGLITAAALTGKAAEAAPPGPGFTCFWGDGFHTATWDEMLQHYKTAHPDKPLIQLGEGKWV